VKAPNKVLVAGGRGRLGRALGAVAGPRVCVAGRDVLDITDADTIARALLEVRPAAVINAAVASGIELAEADPSNAQAINAVGPANWRSCADGQAFPLSISRRTTSLAPRPIGLGGKRIPCLR